MATCLREALRRRQGTPLVAFFNIPIRKKGLRELALRPIGLFNGICIETLEPEKRREELDDANP
jgi:hypothetical protein